MSKLQQPEVSFDEDLQKPKFLNNLAVLECLKIMIGQDSKIDFVADDKFIKYYEKVKSKKDPSQKEINDFMKELVIQCAKHKVDPSEPSEFYLDGDRIKHNGNS